MTLVSRLPDERPWARPARDGGKVAEALARAIVRDVVSRNLAPGTLLPPEGQMLVDYGVGRGSLREALRILEMHGLITMKAGRKGGPVVIEVSARAYARMSSLFFHVAGMTFQQLVDARLVLQAMLARLAAERGGPPLDSRPAGLRVEDTEAYVRATQEFHAAVASRSGNPVLGLMALSMEEMFHDQVRELRLAPGRRREVLGRQQEIAAAITEGRPDDAEDLMRRHLQDDADHLREVNGPLMDRAVAWR